MTRDRSIFNGIGDVKSIKVGDSFMIRGHKLIKDWKYYFSFGLIKRYEVIDNKYLVTKEYF